MNLEDYFEMLHKMAQPKGTQPTDNHGQDNAHQDIKAKKPINPASDDDDDSTSKFR
jgi:hypothetical protein